MSAKRVIRVGVIAEGKTELKLIGNRILPEDGGKVIAQENEGALHTFIRRELDQLGYGCEFIQLHPEMKSTGAWIHTGHNILETEYIKRRVSAWKAADNVDVVVICVDADNKQAERQERLQKAIEMAQKFHIDGRERKIPETAVGGLAIPNIEAWLIADETAVTHLLAVSLPADLPDDLESLSGDKHHAQNPKNILKQLMPRAKYKPQNPNEKISEVCWQLALLVDLVKLKKRCPQGYGTLAKRLETALPKSL